MKNWKIKTAKELISDQKQLENLEKSIKYPIENGKDFFTISHGKHYTRFFERIGNPLFLIVKQNRELAGIMVAVWKAIKLNHEEITVLYFADTKINKKYRGKSFFSKMLLFALYNYIINTNYRQWKFIFFAGMVGTKGDVTRSFKRFNLGKLSKPISTLQIFFLDSQQLINVQFNSLPNFSSETVDFSPNNKGLSNTKGIKDLVTESTGLFWNLYHFNIDITQPLSNQFSRIQKEIINTDKILCFGVDSKQIEILDWFEQNNIKTDTLCNLYIFKWPWIKQPFNSKTSINLSTGEI